MGRVYIDPPRLTTHILNFPKDVNKKMLQELIQKFEKGGFCSLLKTFLAEQSEARSTFRLILFSVFCDLTKYCKHHINI